MRWSLAGLAAGLLLGMVGQASGGVVFERISDVLDPIGALWLAALQMTVLPLVIVYLLAAILGTRGTESLGWLGARAISLFVIMLAGAGVLTLIVAPPIIRQYTVEPATIAALQAATPVPEAARAAAGEPAGSIGAWVSGLLPTNLFDALLRGDIFQLLVFTALFGAALTRLPAEYRDPFTRVVKGASEAMMEVVRWILLATPLAVFVLTYSLALATGGFAAEILAAFVIIVSGMIVVCTLVLYPVSALLGRTSMRTFARAVAPAQLVAVSTRSSIASLPALIEGGRTHLNLPLSATGFVLPLTVSLFKINRPVSALVKLLFVAHVYGVVLGPGQIVTFLLTVMMLSFATVGVPLGGSAFKTLPAYLAAGAPIEGIVIMEAVEMIPDIFKTVVNVTGNMSVATLLSRSSRTVPVTAAVAEPVAAPVTGAV
jgi:Na+/H+-dicarboxylate symporter